MAHKLSGPHHRISNKFAPRSAIAATKRSSRPTCSVTTCATDKRRPVEETEFGIIGKKHVVWLNVKVTQRWPEYPEHFQIAIGWSRRCGGRPATLFLRCMPPQNFASSPSGILPPLARKSAKQSPDAASPMQTEAVMDQRKGNLSK